MTKLGIEKDKNGRKRLVSSKMDVAIHTLFVLIITTFIVFYWLKRFFDSSTIDSLVVLFFKTIMASTTSGMIIMVITGLVRNDQLKVIIQQITEFDKRILETVQLQRVYKRSYYNKILLSKLLLMVLLVTPNAIDTDLNEHYALTLTDFVSYYVFFAMILISAAFYCCLILACWNRIKFINNYIEKLLFGTETVACIETKLTPVANVCYKLEDIKTELCCLIDTVEDINKYFEIQLSIKTASLFLSILWAAYYFIKNSEGKFEFVLFLRTEHFILVWSFISIVDFCIEVHTYQRFLAEVSK